MDEALIGGKYRLIRAIATGGMGTVHEALHVGTEGRVAIKVLSEGAKDDESSRRRFSREAKASGRLRSRHVARVLDVDALADGTPYIVMEYLAGHDLAKEIKTRGPLPMAEAATILVQAAAGVAEAHAAGIVHRDLKPGNVFLAEEGAQRVVKVLDFGISKMPIDDTDPEEITRTFASIGTPGYMSPEQIRSPRDVDAASDVWSMGVILYRVLAGRVPFSGNSSSIAVSICNDPPAPLVEVRSDVPADVLAIIDRALAKDRTLRPSIIELAEVLIKHTSEPIAREAFAELARGAGGFSGTRPAAVGIGPTEPTVAAEIAPSGRTPARAIAVAAVLVGLVGTLLVGIHFARAVPPATSSAPVVTAPQVAPSVATTASPAASVAPVASVAPSLAAAPARAVSASLNPSVKSTPPKAKAPANATETPAVPPRL